MGNYEELPEGGHPTATRELYGFAHVSVRNDHGDLVYSRTGAEGEPPLEMARYSASTLHIYPKEGANIGTGSAYKKLVEIRLENIDEPQLQEGPRGGTFIPELPHGLGRSFHYGLTFPQRFRCIRRAIEEGTECTVLLLTREPGVTINGDILSVSYERFNDLVAEIERYHGRATTILSRLREAASRNLVAEAKGQPAKEVMRGRRPAIQKLTDSIRGEDILDAAEEADAINMLTKQASSATRRHPAAIGRLCNDLNVASLEILLERFNESLSNKGEGKNERFWQTFFEDNPFALQQLFGAPVVSIYKKQLHVRSPQSDGRGAQIVDFLLANTLTCEGLVVEIKKPQTLLMNATPYRGSGSSAVFSPSPELVGAVAQIQAQKESLKDKIHEKLPHDDPLAVVSSASPRGGLIVGKVGDLGRDATPSFQRYRNGLNDVTIFGFDEVAGRLGLLLKLLQSTKNL